MYCKYELYGLLTRTRQRCLYNRTYLSSTRHYPLSPKDPKEAQHQINRAHASAKIQSLHRGNKARQDERSR